MVAIVYETTNELEETQIRYVFGVDPGTGSRSACGASLIDIEEMRVLWSAALYPRDNKPQPTMIQHHRIKLIVEQLMVLHAQAVDLAEENDSRVLVAIESFVMRGKGGATLEQFRGAAMSSMPLNTEIKEIQNTTVKKYAGGKGTANKLQIGEHLKTLLPKSADYIELLIKQGRWDEIDAIGIAYSAKHLKGL